ncbi:hypothetical protein CHUAL_001202 [Chamberlinius hualienensis]
MTTTTSLIRVSTRDEQTNPLCCLHSPTHSNSNAVSNAGLNSTPFQLTNGFLSLLPIIKLQKHLSQRIIPPCFRRFQNKSKVILMTSEKLREIRTKNCLAVFQGLSGHSVSYYVIHNCQRVSLTSYKC